MDNITNIAFNTDGSISITADGNPPAQFVNASNVTTSTPEVIEDVVVENTDGTSETFDAAPSTEAAPAE